MVESDWIWTIFIKPNPKAKNPKHFSSIWSNYGLKFDFVGAHLGFLFAQKSKHF